MDTSAFYGAVTTVSFTLLGLWWIVAERRKEWFRVPTRRRMAYVVSLHFMLPGSMSALALVAPDRPIIWRVVFTICAVTGIIGMVGVAKAIREEFGRVRLAAAMFWIALPVYVLVIVVAVLPDLSRSLDLQPRQAEAFLVTGIVLLGLHAAWFLATEPTVEEQRTVPPAAVGPPPGPRPLGPPPSGPPPSGPPPSPPARRIPPPTAG